MKKDHTTINAAIAELMNHDGGIDASELNEHFNTPELLKSLYSGVQQGMIVWDEDRIHIHATLFFSMKIQGVAF